PQLAGIKHLNRLEQVLVKQQQNSEVVDDLLVCDADGVMIETGAANLFWQQQGIWFTPELGQSGVTGVMRNLILEQMQQKGIAVQTVRVHYQQLVQAVEIYICNSLMKIVPVISFNRYRFTIDQVRTFQQWLAL